ncbi:MAG: DUF4359 domain-containing protein [Gloeomargarita sp. SKYG116]|nr:DUF4359 domain-containing protein [Gloeomargarita sp. SKYG116]MCS7226628.1 DUF4359 domain-containing protein [Gloeomargarita sp. SKYB31]MDW8400828.1 DUF4359 domain-containing protein [Gloeomargarita sp. SKYGB_i_bin116]
MGGNPAVVKVSWGALAVVGLAAVGLAVTNPSEQQFLEYAYSTLRQELCPRLPEMLKEAKQTDELLQFFTPYLQQSCSELLLALKEPTKEFLRRNTKVQNYLVFSIYTTDLFGTRYRTLGVARQLITIPPR